ncbi:MAG TPA: FAD-dependent oxidoreductase [Acidimicrobiales bacterium]|nr:FAD-dependent oxidoreductase [Acidimicrobiales bacterium]
MTGAGRTDFDVAVIGAGLAGLVSAITAAREGASVVLIDARSPGGRARSDQRSGYTFNQGPHALYRAGAGAAVLQRLGLSYSGAPPHTRVAGYYEASWHLGVMPTSGLSLLRSDLAGGADKIRLGRLLTTIGRLDPSSLGGQSAQAWIRSRHLGEGGSAVLSALVRVATYAGDLRSISADAAVSQLQLVLRGNVIYLDGGWQTLVDGLLAMAKSGGARVITGARISPLGRAPAPAPAGHRSWSISSPTMNVHAAAVVIAVGSSRAAAALVPGEPNWDLCQPVTAACLDLGLRKPPTTRVAFGLDQPLYLSTHSPNARLAPNGGAMVHVMRYGARSAAEDRAQLWSFAQRCGITPDDVVSQRFLHEMTVYGAAPAPGAGLAGRPSITSTGLPGGFVAGDWVGPVGLLADAAMSSGESAGTAAARSSMSLRSGRDGMVAV